MTPPTAPVLLVLDTELQDRPIPPHEKLVIPKLPKIAPLIGDPGAVGEAAQLLVDAASPVIVADRCARSQAGIDRLVELAEILPMRRRGSRLWDMKKHYHHTGPAGGGGISFGAPAAAGAALANKKHGRLTLTIQGDGDLMYSPGVLWTCAHSRLPVLYVMHNNRACHQEIMGLQRMANRRQRGVDRTHIGCTLDDPFIDYATVAKGLGVASFGPVTDPNDLGAVLKKAVAVGKRGEPALVDVVSQGR